MTSVYVDPFLPHTEQAQIRRGLEFLGLREVSDASESRVVVSAESNAATESKSVRVSWLRKWINLGVKDECVCLVSSRSYELKHTCETSLKLHSTDPSFLFSGVVVAASEEISLHDQAALFGSVLALGGAYRTQLTNDTTHFIVLSPSNKQYSAALAQSQKPQRWDNLDSNPTQIYTGNGLRLILPHYFDDCVKVKRRLSESAYCWPDPGILKANLEWGPLGTGVISLPLSAKEQIPPKNTNYLKGQVIYIGPESASQISKETIASLKSHGATITSEYNTSCTIVILPKREGKIYIQAERHPTQLLATPRYLLDSLTTTTLPPPKHKLLHYPAPANPIPHFSGFRICATNYVGQARSDIEILITQMGGTYTRQMTQENTHVICARPFSEKTTRAHEWDIPVLNHLWLEECYRQEKVVSPTRMEFLVFPVCLARIVGDAWVLPHRVEKSVRAAERALDIQAGLVRAQSMGGLVERGPGLPVVGSFCEGDDEGVDVIQDEAVEIVKQEKMKATPVVGVRKVQSRRASQHDVASTTATTGSTIKSSTVLPQAAVTPKAAEPPRVIHEPVVSATSTNQPTPAILQTKTTQPTKPKSASSSALKSQLVFKNPITGVIAKSPPLPKATIPSHPTVSDVPPVAAEAVTLPPKSPAHKTPSVTYTSRRRSTSGTPGPVTAPTPPAAPVPQEHVPKQVPVIENVQHHSTEEVGNQFEFDAVSDESSQTRERNAVQNVAKALNSVASVAKMKTTNRAVVVPVVDKKTTVSGSNVVAKAVSASVKNVASASTVKSTTPSVDAVAPVTTATTKTTLQPPNPPVTSNVTKPVQPSATATTAKLSTSTATSISGKGKSIASSTKTPTSAAEIAESLRHQSTVLSASKEKSLQTPNQPSSSSSTKPFQPLRQPATASTITRPSTSTSTTLTIPAKRSRRNSTGPTSDNWSDIEFTTSARDKRARRNSQPPPPPPVKLITTGGTKIDKTLWKDLTTLLNCTDAKEIETCTHLITNKIVRTEKFIAAITLGKQIVTSAWVNASLKAGVWADVEEYRPLDDAGEYPGFSVGVSISRAKAKKLLSGFNVYATPRVSPDWAILKRLVECAGGKMIPPMSIRKLSTKDIRIFTHAGRSLGDSSPLGGDVPMGDKGKVILVSCEEDEEMFGDKLRGFGVPLYSVEVLIGGLMDQQLKLDDPSLFL